MQVRVVLVSYWDHGWFVSHLRDQEVLKICLVWLFHKTLLHKAPVFSTLLLRSQERNLVPSV